MFFGEFEKNIEIKRKRCIGKIMETYILTLGLLAIWSFFAGFFTCYAMIKKEVRGWKMLAWHWREEFIELSEQMAVRGVAPYFTNWVKNNLESKK